MPPGLLEATMGILRLSVLLVIALFLPLILQLLLLFWAGRAFSRLAYTVSDRLASLLDLVGTPVHEFSHAIAFLITGCSVQTISPLIDPETREASTGFTQANRLGYFLAGLAPLLGGTLVLWLTARYIIPGFTVPEVPLPQLDLESAASLGTVVKEAMGYLGRLLIAAYGSLFDLAWRNWRTYVGLYVALSVGIAIAPSSSDIRAFARGLPVAVALVLILAAWLYFAHDANSRFLTLQAGIVPHLLRFLTTLTYAFALTSLGALLFLPLAVWKQGRVGENETSPSE